MLFVYGRQLRLLLTIRIEDIGGRRHGCSIAGLSYFPSFSLSLSHIHALSLSLFLSRFLLYGASTPFRAPQTYTHPARHVAAAVRRCSRLPHRSMHVQGRGQRPGTGCCSSASQSSYLYHLAVDQSCSLSFSLSLIHTHSFAVSASLFVVRGVDAAHGVQGPEIV